MYSRKTSSVLLTQVNSDAVMVLFGPARKGSNAAQVCSRATCSGTSGTGAIRTH